MITKITGKNQVTVPAEIARKAGIRPGTRLDWRTTAHDHVLEVHVLPDPSSLASHLRGRGNLSRKRAGSPIDRLVGDRVKEDRERSEQ